MGKVIPLPALGSPFHEVCSDDSVALHSRPLASVSLLRSRRPKTRAESAPAATTSQRSDIPSRDREPCRPAIPKFQICLEGLAFPELIMDDKSMQLWTNAQLTAGETPRTMVGVGRPKETTSPAAYRASFFKRVRAARALFTENPPEMAKALGVPRDTYYRYEERTMLPHHLIPRFCEITGVTVDWLINGPSGAQAIQRQHALTGTDHR